MSDPEFLDLEDVLLIHREQLGRFGGGDGLRDQGLLESAIAMPRATFGGQFVHESVFAIAIAERRLDKAGMAALLERLSRSVGGEGEPR